MEKVAVSGRIRTILEDSSLKEVLFTSSNPLFGSLIDTDSLQVISNVVLKLFENAASTSMFTNRVNPRRLFCRRSQDETVDHIKEIRVSWESGILEELKAIVAESKRPFVLIRLG